jgi:hypothetical protein
VSGHPLAHYYTPFHFSTFAGLEHHRFSKPTAK